ncbi:MAG: hypothetical protein JJT78_08095 [Leptospira sp.]|nr:hypothetical protein [Leptospira sp.]
MGFQMKNKPISRFISSWGYSFLLASLFFSCSKSNSGEGENLSALLGLGGGSRNSEEIPFTLEQQNPNPEVPIFDEPTPSDSGFGSNGPEAKFDFDPRAVDPYSPIRIRFSQSVESSTLDIGNNVIVRDENGDIISGITHTWSSPVTISLRANPALIQNTEYTLEINPPSAPTKLIATNSFGSEEFHHFLDSFTTEPGFPVSLKVFSGLDEFDFSNTRALVFDSSLHPVSGMKLKIILQDSDNLNAIKSIALCKLGVVSSGDTISCTEGVGRGIQLCYESSCTQNIETNLDSPFPATLRLTPGVNNYFYRIESFSGRYFYRTLNFVWGELHKEATDLAPDSDLTFGANLSIVQSQGATAVSGIIEAFSRGEFTLKDTADNQNKTLNGYLNNSSTTHPGTVNGKTCLDWPISKFPNGIKYLNRIGPFCGIEVTGNIFESSEFSDVSYSATADIYITEIELDESVWDGSDWSQNIQLTINPEDGYLDLILNGKKATGRMAAVVKIDEIEFFDYLLGDTIVYYSPPNGAPGFNSETEGPDGEGIAFGLNEGNTTPRKAFARTKITANHQGDAIISMNPSAFPEPFMIATQCGSLPDPVPYLFDFICNPWATPWSTNITTSSIVGTGAVAAIVGDVIEQKIPEVKPRVVQGVIRDIATKVAPDILNNILGQVRDGIEVGLPGYLPPPLNSVNLTIKAQLMEGETLTRTRRSGSSFGLEASARAGLLACIKDGSNRCPWELGYLRSPLPPVPLLPGYPSNQDSFVVQRNGQLRNLPSTIDRWFSNPGVLLSIHEDTLNQAFYWLWKTGGLNLTIDRDFIEDINQFTGGSTLLRLTTSLLKADPILTVISPGSSSFAGIYPNDDVALVVNPVVAPQISLLPMSGGMGDSIPKLGVNLTDLKISVIGKMTDPARGGTPPGTDYTIGNVRISLISEADLNLGTYQLPETSGSFTFHPDIIASVGNPSLQLVISGESGKLFYILEVLDDPINNPLGLRPDSIYEVLEPLVKDLIIPLLNNVVRDIPIPRLRACGLDLTNVKTIPIPNSTSDPYILIHANAGNYGFFGNCEL